jgi:hypothetical protein
VSLYGEKYADRRKNIKNLKNAAKCGHYLKCGKYAARRRKMRQMPHKCGKMATPFI